MNYLGAVSTLSKLWDLGSNAYQGLTSRISTQSYLCPTSTVYCLALVSILDRREPDWRTDPKKTIKLKVEKYGVYPEEPNFGRGVSRKLRPYTGKDKLPNSGTSDMVRLQSPCMYYLLALVSEHIEEKNRAEDLFKLDPTELASLEEAALGCKVLIRDYLMESGIRLDYWKAQFQQLNDEIEKKKNEIVLGETNGETSGTKPIDKLIQITDPLLRIVNIFEEVILESDKEALSFKSVAEKIRGYVKQFSSGLDWAGARAEKFLARVDEGQVYTETMKNGCLALISGSRGYKNQRHSTHRINYKSLYEQIKSINEGIWQRAVDSHIAQLKDSYYRSRNVEKHLDQDLKEKIDENVFQEEEISTEPNAQEGKKASEVQIEKKTSDVTSSGKNNSVSLEEVCTAPTTEKVEKEKEFLTKNSNRKRGKGRNQGFKKLF